MKSINHSHWYTTVNVTGPGTLSGRTMFMSTELECAVTLSVDISTFRIQSATWEVYRGPVGALSADLDGLKGVEAYFGSGEQLREAVLKKYGQRAHSLVSETVRGIIQAETFLIKERGYESPESYDQYWTNMYKNSCRYYSNLDRVSVHWADHISGQERFNGNLYNKFKDVLVSDCGDTYHIASSLSDSFHEVGINIILDKNSGAVLSADCRLLRAPDAVCFESGGFSQALSGVKAAGLTKRDVARLLGGSQGCVHMIDLCYDVVFVLNQLLQ
ncbi:MAG: DUF2889 domain-containing protein [Bacillota bacterium]